MFDWVLNTSASFFQETFCILLRNVSRGKKLGKLRNGFLQMCVETSPNKLSLLQKSLYIISLSKTSMTT